jgi:glutathione S-transferase
MSRKITSDHHFPLRHGRCDSSSQRDHHAAITGESHMVERVVRATTSGWRPWALGAAFSLGCAAFLLFRMQRSATRKLDEYEQWWQQRDRIRANGGDSRGSENPHLFV